MRAVSKRTLIAAAMLASAAHSFGIINIQLEAFPRETVADNRSQITLSLTVRNADGSIAPNGTRVILNTTLGTFRETILQTVDGKAQAVLIAGNIPGVAKITASEFGLNSNPTVIEVEFVKDKSQLSNSGDFVLMSTKAGVEYSSARKLLTASDTVKKVSFQLGDKKFQGTDIQYNIDSRTVRGRNVSVVWDKPRKFEDLFYDFRKKEGYATEVGDYWAIDRVLFRGGIFTFQTYNSLDDVYEPVQKKRRLLIYRLTKSRAELTFAEIPKDIFKFENPRFGEIAYTKDELAKENPQDEQLQRIVADQVTIVGTKEYQFTNAKLYLGQERVLTQKLLRLDGTASQNPVNNLGYLTVTDSQFNVNYPYYLNLQRESATGIRFRSGQLIGRGVNINRGVFFDFEKTWDRANQTGSLVYSGIGRDDFNLGYRQFSRLNDQTNVNFVLDAPQAKTLIGNGNLTRQERGFQITASTGLQQTLQGSVSNRRDYGLVVEKDPIKLGKKVPFRLFAGVNAFTSSFETSGNSGVANAYGTRFRLQSDPIMTDRTGAAVNIGGTLSQQIGTINQFATSASVNYTKAFGNKFLSVLTYDFAQDGFTEEALGAHRMSGQFNYQDRRFQLSLFGTQSLGVDRLSVFGDASLRITNQFRLAYQYTLSRFLGDSFIDYNATIAFRKGPKDAEIGLLYSAQTQRIGIVLLGASRF
jgi:hypothetical protein